MTLTLNFGAAFITFESTVFLALPKSKVCTFIHYSRVTHSAPKTVPSSIHHQLTISGQFLFFPSPFLKFYFVISYGRCKLFVFNVKRHTLCFHTLLLPNPATYSISTNTHLTLLCLSIHLFPLSPPYATGPSSVQAFLFQFLPCLFHAS